MKRIVIISTIFLFLFAFLSPAQAEKKKEGEKYEQWLKEEIKLLIAPEEEAAFKKLSSDEEKDEFIELFWAKRDPSPGLFTTEHMEYTEAVLAIVVST